MPTPDRRTFLVAASTGALSVAGCLGLGSHSSPDSPESQRSTTTQQPPDTDNPTLTGRTAALSFSNGTARVHSLTTDALAFEHVQTNITAATTTHEDDTVSLEPGVHTVYTTTQADATTEEDITELIGVILVGKPGRTLSTVPSDSVANTRNVTLDDDSHMIVQTNPDTAFRAQVRLPPAPGTATAIRLHPSDEYTGGIRLALTQAHTSDAITIGRPGPLLDGTPGALAAFSIAAPFSDTFRSEDPFILTASGTGDGQQSAVTSLSFLAPGSVTVLDTFELDK